MTNHSRVGIMLLRDDDDVTADQSIFRDITARVISCFCEQNSLSLSLLTTSTHHTVLLTIKNIYIYTRLLLLLHLMIIFISLSLSRNDQTSDPCTDLSLPSALTSSLRPYYYKYTMAI